MTSEVMDSSFPSIEYCFADSAGLPRGQQTVVGEGMACAKRVFPPTRHLWAPILGFRCDALTMEK